MGDGFFQVTSYGSDFNQPIGAWNVGNVIDMRKMYFEAKNFNQALDEWNLTSLKEALNLFNGDSLFYRNQETCYWYGKTPAASMCGPLEGQFFNCRVNEECTIKSFRGRGL